MRHRKLVAEHEPPGDGIDSLWLSRRTATNNLLRRCGVIMGAVVLMPAFQPSGAETGSVQPPGADSTPVLHCMDKVMTAVETPIFLEPAANMLSVVAVARACVSTSNQPQEAMELLVQKS